MQGDSIINHFPMKKSFSFLFLSLLLASTALGQDAENGTIIFYREHSYQGSANAIRVYMGNELLVRLRNNSYLEYEAAPGNYAFSINRPGQDPLNFTVEAGQTYYIRFGLRMGMWNAIPEMLLVDPASAAPALASGRMRQLTADMLQQPRPKNRMGLNLAVGFGFENHPLFEIDGGGDSKISLGGGVAIGLKYGREFGKHFDLTTELNYQHSSLTPALTNAKTSFARGVFSVTPAYIVPIRDGEEMRFKFGAGLDLYWAGRLKIEGSQVPGGFNDTWKYKSAIGPHLNAIFEMNTSEKFSFVYGLKFYSVGYKQVENGSSYQGGFPELKETSGTGIDLLMGFFYHF